MISGTTTHSNICTHKCTPQDFQLHSGKVLGSERPRSMHYHATCWPTAKRSRDHQSRSTDPTIDFFPSEDAALCGIRGSTEIIFSQVIGIKDHRSRPSQDGNRTFLRVSSGNFDILVNNVSTPAVGYSARVRRTLNRKVKIYLLKMRILLFVATFLPSAKLADCEARAGKQSPPPRGKRSSRRSKTRRN